MAPPSSSPPDAPPGTPATNGHDRTAAGAFGARVRRLAERARREREAFVEPTHPPDPERALVYARDGVGPAVAVYVEARTRDEWVAFSPGEFRLLHRALRDWLRLYAACYGVRVDSDATVREAAELLLATHSAVDVARLLTGVPGRGAEGDGDE